MSMNVVYSHDIFYFRSYDDVVPNVEEAFDIGYQLEDERYGFRYEKKGITLGGWPIF